MSSLQLVDATERDAAHLSLIGFDEVILRLIVQMVAPDEAAAQEPDSAAPRRSQRALRLICDMILEPGSRPLTMTEMEQASGVTSRALCYAFNERFGCAPQEWQRNHFLDRAHEDLIQLGNASSIKAISRKHGFATPHSFTRFYRRRFGQSPSDTLKGGKGQGARVPTSTPADYSI